MLKFPLIGKTFFGMDDTHPAVIKAIGYFDDHVAFRHHFGNLLRRFYPNWEEDSTMAEATHIMIEAAATNSNDAPLVAYAVQRITNDDVQRWLSTEKSSLKEMAGTVDVQICSLAAARERFPGMFKPSAPRNTQSS